MDHEAWVRVGPFVRSHYKALTKCDGGESNLSVLRIEVNAILKLWLEILPAWLLVQHSQKLRHATQEWLNLAVINH